MTRAVRHLFSLGALAVLVLPASAVASADQVMRDCVTDGKLDRKYSNEELRKAQGQPPRRLRRVLATAARSSPPPSRAAPTGAAARAARGVGGDRPRRRGGGAHQDAGRPGGDRERRGASPRESTSAARASSPDSQRLLRPGQRRQRAAAAAAARADRCSDCSPWPAASVALRERVPALARIPLLSKIPTPRVPFLSVAASAVPLILGGALAGVAFGAAGAPSSRAPRSSRC